MPKLFQKTSGSTWTEIKSIFQKIGGTWTEILNVWQKIGGTWTKVFSADKIPGNTVKPTISGTGYLYSTLTNDSLGTWTNSPTSYSRQWRRASDSNGIPGSYSNITGATGTTYVTTSSDDGKWVAIQITATNAAGSNSVSSDPIYINKYTPVSIAVPTFDTMVAKPGTAITVIGTGTSYWKNTTTNTGDTIPDSYTYLWVYEDGTNPVNTNTGVSYTPASGDVGKKLKVTVTAKNTGGTASRTSNLTATVSEPPVVDIYPTISSTNSYKTKYASNLYTDSTTNGTAYNTPAFRGNTGAWTPNPTTVNWYFQYSSDGSTGWTSFYDFEGIPVSSGSTPDTLENQNHDWYLDDFYTSAGGSGTTTSSVGKYVRFASEGFNNSVTAGINYTSAFGPIYGAPSTPGAPTISWVSEFDANNSYISAYWSAATTKFTYYLQYYNGTSWVSLGSGTTSNPTSIAPAGPYLAPHGEKNFRVININADNVFAKSTSVLFDPTPPPGNITNIVNYNFSTWNSNLFLTTGIRTTSVKYTFDSTNLSSFSIGPFTRSTSSSYPYLFTDNLSGYFTPKTWNYDTYGTGAGQSIGPFYAGNTVWYAGNQYTANYIGSNTGFSGQVPTNTTYWTKTTTVTYNIADYVLYNNTYYFCRTATNGTYPTNTTYWSSLAGFVVTATPYNGTKAGTASSAGMTILFRPDANTDPAPNITIGPTFSSITQTGFTTTYNPNTAANTVIIDVKKGSPLSSILTYPKTVNPSSNVDNTDSPSNLTADTTHTVYLTPKYVYNSTYAVEYIGTQVAGTVKTLKQAPTAFSFTLSRGGSVTTPGAPTITRVSSTSNTLLFDIASSKPADTFQYGINQSGAAIVNGSPAQYVTTLNQWDSAGNFGSGIYDTISTIQSSANNSEATISTTAYGTTRAAIANVSTTSGATSWAINFSWSGASANGVTYISNGSGTNSASTSATVTVYATSMPATIATITGANDPTITINNITAYSDANQSGSSTNGSAGATTSLSIIRPTATSASTTQYYTYYAPATKLATPTGVSATTTRTDGVNITWNAVANASYYGIWYGSVPGYDFTPDFQNITGTSYLDTGILQGNSRTYYVQAFPTSGSTLYLKSDWSSGATGTRQVPVSQYTVTWNANGGSVSPTSQTVNSGTSITAPTPTRSGYTFLYWRNPLSGGDPIFLNAGQSYTVVGNITFYAIWQLAGSAPATPTNVSVSTSGLVTWTASSGATSYTVEYYLANSSAGANAYPTTGSGLFSSPDPTGTSYQIAYGTYNGVYLNYARARVRANNANGSSAYSAWYPSSTTYV